MGDDTWDDRGTVTDAIVDIRDVIKAAIDASLTGRSSSFRDDLEHILRHLVNRNVDRALKLASHGVMERLDPEQFDGTYANGFIPIPEAARIVRELDYVSDPYQDPR